VNVCLILIGTATSANILDLLYDGGGVIEESVAGSMDDPVKHFLPCHQSLSII